MATAIEYRTQPQREGELLEGATLFAPSFEATLDRGRRTISYSVADPEEGGPRISSISSSKESSLPAPASNSFPISVADA